MKYTWGQKNIKKTYDEVTMKLGRGIWNLQHNFNLSGLTSKRPQSNVRDLCSTLGANSWRLYYIL